MKKVFDKVVEFDKKLIAKVQKKFGLSDYQVLCLTFVKGFVIGAILLWAMQKIINVLALLSFGASAGIVGAGAYVYLNKDALIEKAKEEVFAQMGEALGGQLGRTLLSGDADPIKDMDTSNAIPLPAIPFWHWAMPDNITSVSDDHHVAMPIRNIISIVAGVAVATWAYSGVIERLNKLETNSTLNQQDIELNNEFRIKWPRGEMGSLPADARQDMEIEALRRYMDTIFEEVEENDDWIDNFGPPDGVLATVETVRDIQVRMTLLQDRVKRIHEHVRGLKERERAREHERAVSGSVKQ